MVVLLVVLPIATLLAAVISQLGGTGRLPRNGVLGLRFPSTMASDDAWRAGHRAATAPAWIGFATITVAAVVTVVFFRVGVAQLAGVIVVAALFVATFIWLFVVASRAATAVEVG